MLEEEKDYYQHNTKTEYVSNIVDKINYNTYKVMTDWKISEENDKKIEKLEKLEKSKLFEHKNTIYNFFGYKTVSKIDYLWWPLDEYVDFDIKKHKFEDLLIYWSQYKEDKDLPYIISDSNVFYLSEIYPIDIIEIKILNLEEESEEFYEEPHNPWERPPEDWLDELFRRRKNWK